MRRKEREVTNPDYLEEMLEMFETVNVGMNDDDGYPYVVPMNYGFDRTDEGFVFYVHFAKQGHKVDLLKKDPRVCLTMSLFQDYPDDVFIGHKHDYRSVIAKGKMEIFDMQDHFEEFMKAHEKLMIDNGREFNWEERAKKMPPMYMGRIVCKYEDVRGKSEFPIKSIEDVHFKKTGRKKPL